MTATKRIRPTVLPREVLDDTEDIEWVKAGTAADEKGLNLPPIHHIKQHKMQHMSTKIRWFCGLGYTVKEVSSFLGVRYQQVRNVATTTPKRAAREDVPPFIIETFDVEDDLEAMEAHALEVEMAAQREQDRKARKDARRKPKDTDDDKT